MNKWSFLSLALVFFASCGSEPNTQDALVNQEDPLSGFSHFPDTVYEGIYLGMPTEQARQKLFAGGFELVDSSGALYFERFEDSSTFILVEHTPEIKEIKLILRSANIIADPSALEQLLARDATRVESSGEFKSFDYMKNSSGMSLTLFIQESSVRLHLRSHHSR